MATNNVYTSRNMGGGVPRSHTKEDFAAMDPNQRDQLLQGMRNENYGLLPGWAQLELRKSQGLDITGEAALGEQNARLQAQLDEQERMRKLGLMPDGSPIRPDYNSLLDPKTGLLQSQYQMTSGELDPSKMEGYQAYKKNALRTGPSDWATLMLKQQEQKRVGNMEKAAAQSSSSTANARAGLSMRGGMSAGSRERIALQGSRDLLAARQGVGRDTNIANIGIQTQDEQDKQGFLKGLPGMEADIEKYNIGNRNKTNEFNIMRALEEKRAKDAQDLTVYQEQLKKWGSERQAVATERSGGGGGGK
jgi:hypothetical protein